MTKGTKKPIPDSFFFHCFDCVSLDNLVMPLKDRINLIPKIEKLQMVKQELISIPENAQPLKDEFKQRLDEGFEGLMIRGADKKYKFGRSTPTDGVGYKFKLYETHDAKILGVQQATKVDKNAEKKINASGRSVTSKKLGDRVLIEQASGFECIFEGQEFVVSLGLSDERCKEIWENKEKYIGEKCEFKAMLSVKDAPRSPGFLRMRWNDQDE
jgi:ATP-dependent DNA ligase